MLYEIEFPLASLNSETVETALLDAGAISITFLDRGDEPVLEPKPGEFRLWSDTSVRALFDDSHEAASTIGALSARLGSHITAAARLRSVEARDWERAWLQDWKSMRFGRRLWVCPTEDEPPADPDAVVVRLDPGLAFGTGTHPTTALCLQLLGAAEQSTLSAAQPPTEETHSIWNCPVCGGTMRVVERLSAAQLLLRSPPQPDQCAA